MAAGRSDWRNSMKKTISTKDGTHSWDDVQVGDYLVINGKRHLVERRYELFVSACEMSMTVDEWITLGAHLERDVEEHKHGEVPAEPLLHVVFGNGQHAVNVEVECPDSWIMPYGGCEWDWVTQAHVQLLADEHGFTRLVPETEVEEARKEGWKHGIRDAAADLEVTGFDDHARYIRSEYPTAFTQDGDGQDSSTVSVTFTKRSLCAFVECAEAAFNEAEMVDLGSGTSAWTTLLKARVTCEQDGGEQA